MEPFSVLTNLFWLDSSMKKPTVRQVVTSWEARDNSATDGDRNEVDCFHCLTNLNAEQDSIDELEFPSKTCKSTISILPHIKFVGASSPRKVSKPSRGRKRRSVALQTSISNSLGFTAPNQYVGSSSPPRNRSYLDRLASQISYKRRKSAGNSPTCSTHNEFVGEPSLRLEGEPLSLKDYAGAAVMTLGLVAYCSQLTSQ